MLIVSLSFLSSQVVSNVSRKWFQRFKKRLLKTRVAICWDRVTKGSAKATFPLCVKHNALMEALRTCGLCKNQMSISSVCPLGMERETVARVNEELRGDSIPSELTESMFVCKLCKSFLAVRQRADMADYLKNNKTCKHFYKGYRRK